MKKHLRNLNRDDSELLFEWRNHASTRSTSFDKKEFSLASHEKWFYNALNSKFIITYILEANGTPVGVIRFELEDRQMAKINYLIDPSQQEKTLVPKFWN